MKKLLSILLSVVLMVGLLASCKSGGGSTNQVDSSLSSDSKLNVAVVVNGTLGDAGVFDSMATGLEKAIADYGIKGQVIEAGADNTKWESTLADAAESDADIIVAATFGMTEYVQKIAPLYPEKRFFLLDSAVDYSKGDCGNVYSVNFAQNQGSFLAGAFASMITQSKMDKANPKKTVGFVGGMDLPVINDFLVGYIQGAKYVDPDTKVVISYVGDFFNPTKGKEFGVVQVNQGADIVFMAAGESGLGAIQAVKLNGAYGIGVDNDQSKMYKHNGDDETANIILTSMVKNLGTVLYDSIGMHLEDKIPYGTKFIAGIIENGVGLVSNDVYKNQVPADIQKKITEIKDKILSGEIEVSTALGMSQNDLDAIRESVAP